jgi:hypothetical protein
MATPPVFKNTRRALCPWFSCTERTEAKHIEVGLGSTSYKGVRIEFYEGKRVETVVEPQAPTSQREKDAPEKFLHFERECLAKNLEHLRILVQIKAKRSPSVNHTIYHVLQSHE